MTRQASLGSPWIRRRRAAASAIWRTWTPRPGACPRRISMAASTGVMIRRGVWESAESAPSAPPASRGAPSGPRPSPSPIGAAASPAASPAAGRVFAALAGFTRSRRGERTLGRRRGALALAVALLVVTFLGLVVAQAFVVAVVSSGAAGGSAGGREGLVFITHARLILHVGVGVIVIAFQDACLGQRRRARLRRHASRSALFILRPL